MKNLVLLISLTTAIGLSSCNCVTADGEIVEKEIETEHFDKVTIDCSADVVLIQDEGANSSGIVIQTEENIIDLVEINVNDNELVISMNGCIINSSGIKVFASMSTISELTIDGSGSFSTEGQFVQDEEIVLNIEGSGDADLEIITNRFEVNIEGSGDVTLAGDTKQLDISVEGSGDIDASGCKANIVDVAVDGSGDTKVHATQKLSIEIDGSGDVKYQGDPSVSTDIDGSGDIKKL